MVAINQEFLAEQEDEKRRAEEAARKHQELIRSQQEFSAWVLSAMKEYKEAKQKSGKN